MHRRYSSVHGQRQPSPANSPASSKRCSNAGRSVSTCTRGTRRSMMRATGTCSRGPSTNGRSAGSSSSRANASSRCKRIVAQRQAEGDRAFIEGIEIMSFLATLVGLTSVERFIPLATHETERRDVLEREAGTREGVARARGRQERATGRHRPFAHTRRVAHRRTPRGPPKPRARCPCWRNPRRRARSAMPAATGNHQAARRAAKHPPVKPKKAPTTVTQPEHVVIADAVRLLGWGKQWHELADMIARLVRAAQPLGNPPHPAHLPRPDRRRRHPPTRLTPRVPITST